MNSCPKVHRRRIPVLGYFLATGLFAAPVVMADGVSIQTEGDGVFDGVSIGELRDALCDYLSATGATPLPPSCVLIPGQRFLFATSTASTSGGNILQWANNILTPTTFTDSLEAADGLCQKHADDAALPGTYSAWLSTDTVNAESRIGDYIWITRAGEIVADDKAQLTSCTAGGSSCLQNQIANENGVVNSFEAWTGTGADGTSSNANCLGWTSSSGGSQGYTGDPNQIDFNWTKTFFTNCNLSRALYCFGN